MKSLVHQVYLLGCTLFLISGLFQQSADAQVTRGFDRGVKSFALRSELTNQPTMWVMQVEIKPMRMIWVDMRDRSTGETEQKEVWYLVWRAINRPLSAGAVTDTKAVNRRDPLPGPMQFMPHFTLITYDDPTKEIPAQILPDQILPDAVEEIEKREKLPTGALKNSVSAIQDVPAKIDPEAEEQPWIYGVATWTGVDPRTDFFSVMMHGFSNGYENRSDDPNRPELWRKVIVQKFARPGDEFDPNLKEFLFSGSPEWTYQPDQVPSQSTVSE